MAHPNGDEYERYLFENGWVGPNKDGTLDENGEKPEHGPEPWISAMYWAVTTMSTIGYGDISPGTLPERILGMFIMCIGCAFFAWITGKITQLMTEKHACQTRFDETLEDLEAFMTQRVLPVALRERIRNYYKVRFPNKQVFDESAIISDIEAPALKKEIVLHLYRDVVASVPIFRILHSDTQKEICFRLQSRYRMPGRVVTIAGTVPDSMYVIRFGQVSIKTSGERNFVAQQGDLFGELAIMGLTPNGLRMRTAIAVTVCELCEFSKEDFWELLTTQRGFLHMICKVTRMHLLRLKHNFAIAKQFLEDKTGPRPEHFWDLMGHIEWKSICQLLQAEGEGDRRREENAKLDPIKIEQIESQTGKTMLLTSFRMQLNSIGPVTTNNPHHLHVIVMKWPGIPNLPLTAAGNETKTFVLQEEIEDKEDHYEIQRDIEIPVIYPHGLIWKDLEPLTIQVLSYPDDDDVQQSVLSDLSRRMSSPKRASAVSVTADVVKHDMSGGSLVHPSAKTLYGKHRTNALCVCTCVYGMPTAILCGLRCTSTPLVPCVCLPWRRKLCQIHSAAAHFLAPLHNFVWLCTLSRAVISENVATSLQCKRTKSVALNSRFVLRMIGSWTGSLAGFGQEQGQNCGKKVFSRVLDLPRIPSKAGAARNNLRRQTETAESIVGQNFA